MAKLPSKKRLQIDKTNTNMVIILAVAAFVAVFSLVASRTLISQRSYQSKVIGEKKKALQQLKANNEAAKQLVESYKVFVASPDNIIAGSSTGTGDRDGDNAKIVLDALPSKYDFPALATSMEKVLLDQNYAIDTIAGVDDELNQLNASSTDIKPVEMPFDVIVIGNLDTAQGTLDIFRRSIRPIKVVKAEFTAEQTGLKTSISAISYYQPQKTVQITKQVVK